MGKLADQASALAVRLAPLPARIEALARELSEYVQPHLVDRKARRDAIQIEAFAIVKESWALSTEVHRLAEAASVRKNRGPRIGRHEQPDGLDGGRAPLARADRTHG
jgi:hypothetical protein